MAVNNQKYRYIGVKNVKDTETKARFKRRTLHVPNLIIRFGTCKVRRLNQLGPADLYSGRPPFYSTGHVE